MEFAPRLHLDPFRCFWSTPAAWGSFELSSLGLALVPVAGSVTLKEVLIHPTNRAPSSKFKITSGDRETAHSTSLLESGTLIQFSPPVAVSPEKPLKVQILG